MRHYLVALAAALMLLVVPAGVVASGWKVVTKETLATGLYGGGTIVAATVSHAHALAIRLTRASADLTLLCQVGENDTQSSAHYGPGLHALKRISSKATCTVSLSISGTGTIGAEILKR
jgi:hypothetical protein